MHLWLKPESIRSRVGLHVHTVNYGELIHSKPLIYFKGQKGYNTRALNDIMNKALVVLIPFHTELHISREK